MVLWLEFRTTVRDQDSCPYPQTEPKEDAAKHDTSPAKSSVLGETPQHFEELQHLGKPYSARMDRNRDDACANGNISFSSNN